MIERKRGSVTSHVIVALPTAWWTLGIGNLLYWAYEHFVDVDERVIRADESA